MSNADCLFFLKNNCTKSGCTFRHQAGLSASTPRCRYFPNCTNPACTFLHLTDENYARLAPAGARGFGGPGGAPGFNPMAMNPMAAMLSNPAMLGLMMAQMAQAQGFPVPSAGKGKRNFEEDGDDQQDQQQHYDDEEEQDSRARNRNKGRNSQSQTGSHGNTGGRDSSSGRERGRDSGSSHTSRDRNDQKPEGLLKPPLLAQPTRPDYQARKPQTSQRQPPSDFSSSSRNQTKTQPRSVSVSLTPAFQNAAGRDRRPTGSQSSANSTNTTNNTTRAKHTPATSNSATTLQVSPAVLEKRRAAAATAAPAKTTTTGGKPDWGVKPLTNLLDTSVLGKRDREETTDAGTHSEEQADGTYDDQDQYQDQDQDQDQDQQYDDQEPSPKRLREDDPDLNLSYGDLEAGDDLNLTYEDTDQQYQEPEPSEGDGQ